jgi:hypothetical protein
MQRPEITYTRIGWQQTPGTVITIHDEIDTNWQNSINQNWNCNWRINMQHVENN